MQIGDSSWNDCPPPHNLRLCLWAGRALWLDTRKCGWRLRCGTLAHMIFRFAIRGARLLPCSRPKSQMPSTRLLQHTDSIPSLLQHTFLSLLQHAGTLGKFWLTNLSRVTSSCLSHALCTAVQLLFTLNPSQYANYMLYIYNYPYITKVPGAGALEV